MAETNPWTPTQPKSYRRTNIQATPAQIRAAHSASARSPSALADERYSRMHWNPHYTPHGVHPDEVAEAQNEGFQEMGTPGIIAATSGQTAGHWPTARRWF